MLEKFLDMVPPYCKIDDDGTEATIEAEMPGISKDDLELSIQDRILSIKAEKGKRKYYRKFSLSDFVDSDNIKAEIKDGLLSIMLPRKQDQLPKRIEVT